MEKFGLIFDLDMFMEAWIRGDSHFSSGSAKFICIETMLSIECLDLLAYKRIKITDLFLRFTLPSHTV
jgi:hypothetical protein